VATVGKGGLDAGAEALRLAGEALVKRAGVEPGMDVLDVGTGTGNAALPAGKEGARVTGIEPASALLEVARERAADYMLEPEWVEGEVERLPFGDGSFDRVLSVFGHMFAPDQERVASELVRVCRADGAIGLCAWTPEGLAGQMLELLGCSTPATTWGDEARLRELFGGRVETERHKLSLKAESPEELAEFAVESLAPFGIGHGALDELTELFSDCAIEMEYLLAVVRP
jgi:ubiquinone/menaquinone biosynthesis C-methylase UbiE